MSSWAATAEAESFEAKIYTEDGTRHQIAEEQLSISEARVANTSEYHRQHPTTANFPAATSSSGGPV